MNVNCNKMVVQHKSEEVSTINEGAWGKNANESGEDDVSVLNEDKILQFSDH